MSYRSILFCTVALAATMVSVSNCKDDDSSGPTDAGEDVDLSFPDIEIIDQGNIPSKNNATFLFFEVKDQRPDKVAGQVFPVTVVQLSAKAPPSRAPDAIQKAPIELEGLGCVAYKFTSSSPVAQQGPRFIDGNMGEVQVSGFTGTSAPKAPLKFRRFDITAPPPGPDGGGGGGGAGIFNYLTMDLQPFPGDPTQPNLAFRYKPVPEHFLTPGDFISVTASGGDDMPSFPAKAVPAPTSPFTTTTNLWTITREQTDGTRDFKVEYNCGGGPCTNAAAGVAVQFISTDAPLPAANPSDPLDDYQFPYPRQNFGMIICQGLFTHYQSSFIVEKQVMAVLGNWTKLYAQVAPLNIAFGASSNNDRLTVGAGTGYFGLSKR